MKHAFRTRESDATVEAPMDDLVAGLAKANRGPWLTRSTGTMLALVLALGGFLAGVQVQKNFGTTAAAATTGGATGNRPGGFRGGTGAFSGGQQGAFPGGQQAAAPITGKVKLVDGTTVYLETSDGRLLTVKTGDTTTVQTTDKITLKDLAAGTDVTVQGTTSDTTVTATTITAAAGK
ncbi:hypothetical protein [Catellatospora citrea]|uniref:DUF5666 domain-containing protein n=1 Tax=Catellatospora citrea TaxID=53366 RepID=A0A8J3P2T6_9ACTN|nr:hypothetical protein [Catellatospora citrea]RKE09019.1 hypothetical protein C8E86_3895 [Catellatospora citrea]GIG01833.1 hypothetical protein Cci01nite_69260 [Catellatospora citrea]